MRRIGVIWVLLATLLGGCSFLDTVAGIEKERGAVVMLLSPVRLAGGTGFALRTEDGHDFTVTNDHVCALADSDGTMYALDEDGDLHHVSVLYRSGTTDLCFMTPIDGLNSFKEAPSFNFEAPIKALGHPRLKRLTETSGRPIRRRSLELAVGLVEDRATCAGAKNTVVDLGFFGLLCLAKIDAIETDAFIEPGSSGSPALNSAGEVVGVFFAAGDARSFFVPLEDLHRELINASKATR